MADTINTGTMLIEGNAFTVESLRFESEPWTRFYMAGEIIRESQKASGKQSHYASDGNSEAQVIEETECKTFGCGSATGGPSLPTELVKGQTSRKRWPSRRRISSANSAFPHCNPVRWPKTPQNWGTLHLG
jgi:NifU-like N terminal domain